VLADTVALTCGQIAAYRRRLAAAKEATSDKNLLALRHIVTRRNAGLLDRKLETISAVHQVGREEPSFHSSRTSRAVAYAPICGDGGAANLTVSCFLSLVDPGIIMF